MKSCNHVWKWVEKYKHRRCKICGLNQKGYTLYSKNNLMIPARIAIALQDNGWILRNEIVWKKSNNMPSSVKDRLTNTWEPVFHFVKNKHYYYDLDSIREPFSTATFTRAKRNFNSSKSSKYAGFPSSNQTSFSENLLKGNLKGKNPGDTYNGKMTENAESLGSPRARMAREGYDAESHYYNPLGKNPGDYWTVNTKPYKAAHFSTYPPLLLVKPILSSCPINGIVFDPFCGSGTTLAVAKALGRNFIGCDIVKEYIPLAEARISKVPPPFTPITKLQDALKAVEKV